MINIIGFFIKIKTKSIYFLVKNDIITLCSREHGAGDVQIMKDSN